MRRMFDDEGILFFSRWISSPLNIGAVFPSGDALAHLMAAQVDLDRPGIVVELGGGTGAITAALLEVGVAPERLVVIDQDERLYRSLAARFPDVTVFLGDAARRLSRFRLGRADPVGTVVSSLPLLSMSRQRQRAILDQAFACMAGDGTFIQFTYGPGHPVPAGRLARWGYRGRSAGTAWLNLPPATVWRITR